MNALGDGDDPLVLVGVEHLLPLYKEANKYPQLVGEISHGNPNNLESKEIHDRAWEVIEPFVEREVEEVVNGFHALKTRGQAIVETEKILSESFHGQVDTLMATQGEHVWGTFQPESGDLELHERKLVNSRDLVEFSTVHTLRNGGEVYVLEADRMPEGTKDMAAIKRY